MILEASNRKTRPIGRDKQLEQIGSYLVDIKNGIGRTVFIDGETGVGKTRFLNYIKENPLDEYIFLQSRCQYQERADPFLPVYEILKQFRETSFNEESEAIKKIVSILPQEVKERIQPGSPSLLPLGLIPTSNLDEPADETPKGSSEIPLFSLSTSVADQSFSQEVERERVNETLSDIFNEISKEKPLVLIIEDLQWADMATLSFIRYMARNIQDKRIMILGTYNNDDIEAFEGGHPLSEILNTLNVEGLTNSVKLTRLSKPHVKMMLLELLDVEDLPDHIVNRFYEKTQGNPYFLKETVRNLVNDGTIDLEETFWYNKLDLAKVKISSNIKEMMARRIKKLSPEAGKVLKYSSVIGRRFRFDDLMEISNIEEEKVIDGLEELMEHKLISEVENSEDEVYNFDNPVVREIAYENLSRSRKRFLHKRVAKVIEDNAKRDKGRLVFDLAYHYTRGKVQEKALYYLLKAGEKSLGMHAIVDSLKYLNEAEEIVQSNPKNPRIVQMQKSLYYDLGLINEAMGEWDEAMNYYNRSLQISMGLKNPKEQTKIMRSLAEIYRKRGMFDQAEEKFNKAFTICKKIRDYQGLAESSRGLGSIHWRKGEYPQATKKYEESIKFAQRIQAKDIIASIFIEVGNLNNSQGDLKKALKYYEQALDMLKNTSDLQGKSRAYNNIGDVYLQLQDWDKAIAYFKESMRIAKEASNRYRLGWSLFNSAEAYANKGDLDKALVYCQDALKLLRKLDDKIGIAFCNRNFGLIYTKKGDLNEAEKHFKQSENLLKKLEAPYNLAEFYMAYAEFFIAKSDTDTALELLDRSFKLFKSVDAVSRVRKVKETIEALEKNS